MDYNAQLTTENNPPVTLHHALNSFYKTVVKITAKENKKVYLTMESGLSQLIALHVKVLGHL